jgi:two-component system, cell cycle sensor histidine kinase and response regulator CckA
MIADETTRPGSESGADGVRSALAASELRYRRLFESAKDGILILDAASGEIVDVNPFLMGLTGYSRDEFLGLHLWEIGAFKDIAASKSRFAELLLHDYVRYEHLPLEARDGRKVDVEFVSNVYDVDGSKVVQCNIRDITVRKRAEDELRMRDRAIQAVALGLLITDPRSPDNPIVYASPGFSRLTGYTAEESLGRNCRFLGGKGTDPAATAKLRDAVREGRACTVELLNYRKDGTSFWNLLAVSPVTDAEGTLTHFVGVQTDVTERRRLEAQFRQSQKMEAVGRLAGGVAHDFNNLLSVILSYAQIIGDDLKPNDPLRVDIEEISKAALRATELTRQLLMFSRQQVLETKALDLHRTVTSMARLLTRLLGADIEMTVLPATALWSIRADPGQIEQVVMNLAVNARDAMPQGGDLTIETVNVELDEDYAREHHDIQPGPYVMIAITDTGTGMDKETQSRMFEPFFTTKEKGKGTGLGLATVFGIVKQSGGHVWVYSEPGKGTTFKIYFPKIAGVADARASSRPGPNYALATGTILLVEDDEQVRVVAQNILRRAGYVVLVAPNGGEALLICEKHDAKIDLLLTDVVLPRMSGRQLAERLTPLRPEMKVLFMSGYTDDSVLQHGILESGVAYLQKPLTPAALNRKVHEVLHAAPRG